jgi:signal transduction histidine kinase
LILKQNRTFNLLAIAVFLSIAVPFVLSANASFILMSTSDYLEFKLLKSAVCLALIFFWYFHRKSSKLRFNQDLYSTYTVLIMLLSQFLESALSFVFPSLIQLITSFNALLLAMLYVSLYRDYFVHRLSDLIVVSTVAVVIFCLFLLSVNGTFLLESIVSNVILLIGVSVLIGTSIVRINGADTPNKEREFIPVIVAFSALFEVTFASSSVFVLSSLLLNGLLIILLLRLAFGLSLTSARDWQGFHLALNSSSEAFCSYATTGKMLFANKAYRQLFGYQDDTKLTKLKHPLHSHPIQNSLEQKLNEDSSWEGETSLVDIKGEAFPAHLSIEQLNINGNLIQQIWIRSLKDKEQFLNKEQIMLEKLEQLSFNLIEKQEEERRFFAKELHDEIGQGLTLIKIQHQLPEPDNQLITSVLSELIDKVRNLSLNLRPSILDDMGLAIAIEWLVDRQMQFSQLSIECEVDHDIARLNERVEISLFRVLQEAFTNIHKYAHAEKVSVKFWQSDDNVFVQVKDNGVGFDVNAKLNSAVQGKSLGLLGIRERIFLIHGTVDIKSSAQKGTEILIKVPIEQKEQTHV